MHSSVIIKAGVKGRGEKRREERRREEKRGEEDNGIGLYSCEGV